MSQPKQNLVVVVGTTGTGKSKLAVELARLGSASSASPRAEVINGDSMQVYKGLDVLTNKIPTAEMMGVPHHLMSFLDIEEDYTVQRFRDDAIEKIDQIHQKGLLPIVVGGTGYYIQHLILPGRLVKDARANIADMKKDIHATRSSDFDSLHRLSASSIINYCVEEKYDSDLVDSLRALPHDLLQLSFLLPSLPPFSSPKSFPPEFPVDLLPPHYQPPEATAGAFCIALHRALQVVDPVMAGRWHWRDVRKVRRSLEVAVCTGKRMSDLVAEQDQKDKLTTLSQARIPYRTLIFWLYAETELLIPRLDSRVDTMMENGLIDEVRGLKELRDRRSAGESNIDYSRGPCQAIGYREFEPCLEDKGGKPSAALIEQATDSTKVSTRQYAKSQVKWMKTKFIPELNKFEPHDQQENLALYLLDASRLDEWDANVLEPAKKILQDFLDHSDLPAPESLSSVAESILSQSKKKTTRSLDQLQLKTCDVCTSDPQKPVLIEKKLWNEHVQSKRHRSASRPRKSYQHHKK